MEEKRSGETMGRGRSGILLFGGLGALALCWGRLGFGDGVEAHFASGIGGRGHEAAEGIEDYAELAVVLFLHFIELAREFGMGGEQLPETDKGAHDGDIHLHCAVAAQDAGKHGDTLLGEGHGNCSAQFAETRYHSL